MEDKQASIEIIAPSVEEAVEKALTDLNLTEDQVDIEILDSGSKGLLGLGSRHARVKIRVKGETPETLAEEPSEIDELDEEIVSDEIEADEEPLIITKEIVSEILRLMDIHAEIKVKYSEETTNFSIPPIMVDIYGEDLGILIGPKAETLNSLQYISALMVGKELGQAVRLVIDVENYRKRREEQVRKLARSMAEQAVGAGKKQVLEPMPPNERRFVHIELKLDERVRTESMGEEPKRKVVIYPVENGIEK